MKNMITALGADTIEDWSFQQELGGGKASLTLLYKNSNHESAVAKFLISPRNPTEFDNFKNEAEALVKLNSLPKCYAPKIIVKFTQLHSYPVYYYMMEYIQGVVLNNYLNQHKLPWNWKDSTELLCRIAFAVSQGNPMYIHRDLHPGNILLLENTQFDKYSQSYIEPGVRILDYGCSKDVFKDFIGEWYEDKFRHPGAISTWSPEFVRSPDAVDNSHDSWALGVLLYRLITGQYPIYAKSFGELVDAYKNMKSLNDNIEKLDIPEAIKKLLKQMLKENSQERLLPNETFYFSSDILHTNLLDYDDAFIDQYIEMKCSVSRCSRCHSLIGRNQSRCTGCGIVCDEDNLVPILTKKN